MMVIVHYIAIAAIYSVQSMNSTFCWYWQFDTIWNPDSRILLLKSGRNFNTGNVRW